MAGPSAHRQVASAAATAGGGGPLTIPAATPSQAVQGGLASALAASHTAHARKGARARTHTHTHTRTHGTCARAHSAAAPTHERAHLGPPKSDGSRPVQCPRRTFHLCEARYRLKRHRGIIADGRQPNRRLCRNPGTCMPCASRPCVPPAACGRDTSATATQTSPRVDLRACRCRLREQPPPRRRSRRR